MQLRRDAAMDASDAQYTTVGVKFIVHHQIHHLPILNLMAKFKFSLTILNLFRRNNTFQNFVTNVRCKILSGS